MAFVSLQDQGYYQRGAALQDAVNNFVRLRIAQEAEQRAQQQFATEQAVREATAKPQIDPAVVAQNVLRAQAAARSGAKNASYVDQLPDMARLAVMSGKLPTATSSGTTFDPATGAEVTMTSNGYQDPSTGVYTPFGGSRTQAAPPVDTNTTVKPLPAGAPATPGLAIVQTTKTVRGPNGQQIVVGTNESPQRVTPPHGDAAILDMAQQFGVDPDDLKTMLQGLVNKRSATAPSNPNQPKADSVESLNARLAELNAQMEQETDPDKIADLRQATKNIQGRIDAKNRQYTPRPGKQSFRDALGLTPSAAPSPNPNGTPNTAPAPGAASTTASPTESTAGAPMNTPVPPAVPRTTPAGPAKPATTGGNATGSKFTKGVIYRDKAGNRAMFDGTQFVPVPQGQ